MGSLSSLQSRNAYQSVWITRNQCTKAPTAAQSCTPGQRPGNAPLTQLWIFTNRATWPVREPTHHTGAGMSRLAVVSTQVILVSLFIRYCTTFHTSNCTLRFAPRSISTGLGRNPHHEHLSASEHGCSAQMQAASLPLPPVITRLMCAFRCRAWPTCRLLASAGSRTQGRERGWCTLVNTEKRCHPLVRLQDGSVTPQTTALPEGCSEKPGFGRSSGWGESR